MDQREKLIELLSNGRCHYKPNCGGTFCYDEPCVVAVQADYLLANGVVVLPCRCGECEYSEKLGVERWCNEHQIPMGNDDFCPYAKRKGGDE